MPVPSRRDVLEWFNATLLHGPEDGPSLLLCSLIVGRALHDGAPIRIQFEDDARFMGLTPADLRHLLVQLCLRGWVHLRSYTPYASDIDLARPADLQPVPFPGVWEARRVSHI